MIETVPVSALSSFQIWVMVVGAVLVPLVSVILSRIGARREASKVTSGCVTLQLTPEITAAIEKSVSMGLVAGLAPINKSLGELQTNEKWRKEFEARFQNSCDIHKGQCEEDRKRLWASNHRLAAKWGVDLSDLQVG